MSKVIICEGEARTLTDDEVEQLNRHLSAAASEMGAVHAIFEKARQAFSNNMTRKEIKQSEAMNEAIAALKKAGWMNAGHTKIETVRISTLSSPIYGGIGGKVRTLGGRVRFRKGDVQRVTVGPRTTCFYKVVGKKTDSLVNVRTKDIDRIKKLAIIF